MTQGRTSHEAVANYQEALQRLVSCVTPSVVVTDRYHPAQTLFSMTVNDGEPVSLEGSSRLQFKLVQYCATDDEPEQRLSWRVTSRGYTYAIYDSEGREILLYHWHPIGASVVETPHLHLKQGAQVGRAEVRNAHLPTGEVSLNAVLRVLIEEMGVNPRRTDWESILA